MRSFVAITLSAETTDAMARLQTMFTAGRPMAAENLHLTLAFLGDQSEETLAALHEELLQVFVPPFSLTFAGVERFGQVLAIGVGESASLSDLHQRVKSATRRAGIILPRRRFRPHVTIARMKKSQSAGFDPMLSAGATPVLPDMQVTGYALYQSTLHPDGARHDVLAHYGLNLPEIQGQF